MRLSQGSFLLGGSNFVEGVHFWEGLNFVWGEANNKTWGYIYYLQVSKRMRIRIFDHACRLGSDVIQVL